MTNKSRTLYTGVTNNLERRVYEHKNKLVPGFTSKYNITQLVYYEAAVVPPKARELLSRFDERSQHYEVRERLEQ